MEGRFDPGLLGDEPFEVDAQALTRLGAGRIGCYEASRGLAAAYRRDRNEY